MIFSRGRGHEAGPDRPYPAIGQFADGVWVGKVPVQECFGFRVGQGGEFAQQIAHEFPVDVGDARFGPGRRKIQPFDQFLKAFFQGAEHGLEGKSRRAKAAAWNACRLRRPAASPPDAVCRPQLPCLFQDRIVGEQVAEPVEEETGPSRFDRFGGAP